jgi:endonuclease/exonuclease/phosphatase family metal-dependent hydrolase
MRSLLLLIAACSSPTPISHVTSEPQPVHVTPDPTAPKLRVMTYNVNFGLAGDRAGVEAIASASPDIVLLQETTPEWETALVDGLGARFPHHRFEATRNHWVAGGMGLMSRWPIVKVETLTDGGGPFFAHRAIVDAPSGPIQLLNVHLRPPMSDGGSWVVGYFSTRGDREREANAHVAKLDPAIPTIIAGDFNEEDEGMALAVFGKRGFANALPEFQPDADTWHWDVNKDVRLRFRLDHVLHDRHFRAIDAAIVEAGRSDHVPVWVDLERH